MLPAYLRWRLPCTLAKRRRGGRRKVRAASCTAHCVSFGIPHSGLLVVLLSLLLKSGGGMRGCPMLTDSVCTCVPSRMTLLCVCVLQFASFRAQTAPFRVALFLPNHMITNQKPTTCRCWLYNNPTTLPLLFLFIFFPPLPCTVLRPFLTLRD